MCDPICATNPVVLVLESGSPAKSLSTMNVIVSACPCLQNRIAAFGFQTRYFAARLSGTESNYRGSLVLWAKCVCCFCEILLVFGQIRHSHASRSVSCCIYLLQNWTPSPVQHTRVLQFLSWCAHCLRVQVSSTFSDDESSLSQIKFNLQELSCLICLHQEHRVNNRTSFASESSNPSVTKFVAVYFWMRCWCGR